MSDSNFVNTSEEANRNRERDGTVGEGECIRAAGVHTLPTNPGPYYWRQKDGDDWTKVFEVKLSDSMGLCIDTGFYYETVEERGGQWLPIPTAEELVELRAKANAYDEGTVAWFVVDVENAKAIAMSTENRGKATEQAWLGLGLKVQHGCPGGYTCRKVRVCKEVEG